MSGKSDCIAHAVVNRFDLILPLLAWIRILGGFLLVVESEVEGIVWTRSGSGSITSTHSWSLRCVLFPCRCVLR
jgi:hypothetical protein